MFLLSYKLVAGTTLQNKKIAEALTISAQADDGVIEAIEIPYPGNPNCWDIQFHPEYLDRKKSPIELLYQRRIFDAFRQASLQFQYKGQLNQQIQSGFFAKNITNSHKIESVNSIQAKL